MMIQLRAVQLSMSLLL